MMERYSHTTSRIAHLTFLMLALWAAGSLVAQNAPADFRNYHYDFDNIGKKPLDQRMTHKGTYVAGMTWVDAGGTQTLLLCYDQASGSQKRDIYMYQYAQVGNELRLVWDIQDFGTGDCKMHLLTNSLQRLDLDGDGQDEVCFSYQQECPGDAPQTTKMLLFHKGEKLAIRGKVDANSGKEVERLPDPVLNQKPPIFRNFMNRLWSEFVTDGDFGYEYQIKFRTEHFLAFQLEYLFASGGTSYLLTDLSGVELPLGPSIKDKVTMAISLDLMPDGSALLYAGVNGVGVLDPATLKDNAMVTFLKGTEGLSPVAWSPDRTKIAFAALNTSEYPMQTRIFVLTLDGNKMSQKEKYDAKLYRMAASDWVIYGPSFIDNNTLEYTECLFTEEGPEPGPTKKLKLQ